MSSDGKTPRDSLRDSPRDVARDKITAPEAVAPDVTGVVTALQGAIDTLRQQLERADARADEFADLGEAGPLRGCGGRPASRGARGGRGSTAGQGPLGPAPGSVEGGVMVGATNRSWQDRRRSGHVARRRQRVGQ